METGITYTASKMIGFFHPGEIQPFHIMKNDMDAAKEFHKACNYEHPENVLIKEIIVAFKS